MSSTSDFDAWLDAEGPDGFEEAYFLYEAIVNGVDGIYTATQDGDKTFIKGPNGSTLKLLSKDAYFAFLHRIESYKPDRDLDWESAYAYRRAMREDD